MSYFTSATVTLGSSRRLKASGRSLPMPNARSNACIASLTEDRLLWATEFVHSLVHHPALSCFYSHVLFFLETGLKSRTFTHIYFLVIIRFLIYTPCIVSITPTQVPVLLH
jgi:hypothetical protein